MLKNPRIVKIISKVNSMTLDDIAAYSKKLGLDGLIKHSIFSTLQRRRGNEPMHLVLDMMDKMPLSMLLTCKITGDDAMRDIRRLLITDMKGRL